MIFVTVCVFPPVERGLCQQQGVVYRFDYHWCEVTYVGETKMHALRRFQQHVGPLRSGSMSVTQSTWGQHLNAEFKRLGHFPRFSFQLLATEHEPHLRKCLQDRCRDSAIREGRVVIGKAG